MKEHGLNRSRLLTRLQLNKNVPEKTVDCVSLQMGLRLLLRSIVGIYKAFNSSASMP